MKKETAQKIHGLLLECASAIDKSIAVLKEDADNEAEYKAYRLSAGHVLADVMDELLRPIYRQHPDLIPPELDREYLRD